MRSIHWFRRDLRITDNSALAAANAGSDEVIPVYILSNWSRKHAWTGPARQEFLCGCLESLNQNLKSIGGRLIIRCGKAPDELELLIRESGATAIYFNRDPDPFGQEVEKKVASMAARHDCEVHSVKDTALHERDEIVKEDGKPYRVFTPYFKAWARQEKPGASGKLGNMQTPPDIKSLDIPTLAHWKLKPGPSIIEPGENAARQRLKQFLSKGISHYHKVRNTPYGQSTSRISQDLRFGLLSIREIHEKCTAKAVDATAEDRKGIQTFISELCWREFYFQILWHFPHVLDSEFNDKYSGIPWEDDEESVHRWMTGTTGFPIVDAGMRELHATGFMHNRLRMIVAMFLTKDLHVNWRVGEQYFMQQLTDGEIASNNGGWQWSAGTGADAAPYFRIQNPWTQSKRFDPEGKYIRKWVEELQDTESKRLHAPPENNQPVANNYPLPMLDHSKERERTLSIFKQNT